MDPAAPFTSHGAGLLFGFAFSTLSFFLLFPDLLTFLLRARKKDTIIKQQTAPPLAASSLHPRTGVGMGDTPPGSGLGAPVMAFDGHLISVSSGLGWEAWVACADE